MTKRQGVYATNRSLFFKRKHEKNFKNYEKYLYIKLEDGYHLYLGITKNKEIASRLKEYYEKLGYSIYVKETIIESQ